MQLIAAEWPVQVCKLAEINDNLLDMDTMAAGSGSSQHASRRSNTSHAKPQAARFYGRPSPSFSVAAIQR